ncbi:MAG: hypothetical protein A4E55_00358 [Pelotomaculum sp. PtaU1.Bin035]|nr:MAG: hypothetical protein A4E55_00358 [Pelotomaculum sp. PtaU1.Bin035]
MSHFTVAVFTKPGGRSVEEQLAPFHEFECTGIVDQYIQSVDQLEEARKEYEEHTITKLKSPDGKYFAPYEDQFYRDLTEEERKIIGPIAGGGCGNGLVWSSKDWKDGKGFRTKVQYIPDGYEKVKLKASDVMSFRDFAEDYYEKPILFENDEPDIYDKHKWGWMRLNAKGEVIELIDRTNPNSKWDWYQIGGRYQGMLLVKKDPETYCGIGSPSLLHPVFREEENPAPQGYKWVDSAKVKDICWDMMADIERKEREKRWEEAQNKDDFQKSVIYGIKPGATKEDYLNDSGFGTFAVITLDGKWYEEGEMGWWACVSNEKEDWNSNYFDAFIKNTDPESIITIVDCHI